MMTSNQPVGAGIAADTPTDSDPFMSLLGSTGIIAVVVIGGVGVALILWQAWQDKRRDRES